MPDTVLPDFISRSEFFQTEPSFWGLLGHSKEEAHMWWQKSVLLGIAMLTLAGCAATKHARSVEQSGFLKDLYPLMREGKDDESLYIYRSSKIDSIAKGTYTKFMLDPVLLYRGPQSKMQSLPQAQAQILADTFYAVIYQELSKYYEMVTQPGPNTLRGQAVITSLEESSPVLDIVSSIPAPMNVLALGSMLKGLATGKPGFTGEAAIEWKFSDAQTGEVFAAGVDRRVGKKKLDAESFNSWADVYDSMKYWAEKASYRLCQARGSRTDCPKPEA